MEKAKISLGEYELIFSGTIITIKDNPITIKLPDEIEGDYTIIFKFIQDEKNKESLTKYTGIDKFTLQIDFINFEGFQGGGNTDLLNVGSLKKHQLYFNYRVFDLQNIGKTLIYNFYLGKEVSNG